MTARRAASPVQPLLLTIPEVAEHLRLKDPGTVYDLISAGALDTVEVSVRPGGTRTKTRVPMASLEAFIAARTTTRVAS